MTAPKVLIVSSRVPPSVGGASQSLLTLLRQFPRGSHAVLTTFTRLDAWDGITGAWLDCDYHFCDHPSLLVEELGSPAVGSRTLEQRETPAARMLLRLKERVAQTRVLGGLTLSGHMAAQVVRMWQRAIALRSEFQPTVVLGLSDSGLGMIAASAVSRALAVPLVYYILDVYRGNHFDWPLGLIARAVEKSLLTGARTVVLNNEGTRALYAARYPELADRLEILHNAVEPEPYAALRTPYAPRPRYSIVFSGKVYWAQERSLRNLLAAMSLLRDYPIDLRLYVLNPPAWLSAVVRLTPNVSLQAAPPDQMPDVQTGADILFLPLSWVNMGQDIIATATPAKLADYLLAGRPILIHAPPYAYVVKYARQEGFAEVVDAESPEALRDAIKRLLCDPDRARQVIDRALATAERDCSPPRNAAKLMRLLGFESSFQNGESM